MTSLPKFSVENPVLVHVFMLAIIAGGIYAATTLVREMFPESRPDAVSISVLYPGATPEELEKGVVLRIEEAIKDVENIDKISTRISEGVGVVRVTLTSDADDLDQSVNDFKAAVDAIPRDELPEEAEEIRVARFEPRLPVISVTLSGDVSERELKTLGRRLRDDILLLPGVTDVALRGLRKSELSVEVQPDKLIEYRLSLAQVAAAIRRSNLDLPGGQVKTAEQDVAVRTLGETDDAARIGETILRSTPGGQIVRVRDIGRVVDGFEDSGVRGRFNGVPGATVTVYKSRTQDAIDIAQKVRAFVAGKRGEVFEWDFKTRVANLFGVQTAAQRIHQQALNDPYSASMRIDVHSNLSRYIEERLELLTRNGTWGLLLVFAALLMFLHWRVAFWVMMGLVLSMCGAFALMRFFGVTLNLISMFGLIVVLGLIVDDAIVVGENVFARVERGEDPHVAAVRGSEEVAWPVTIAVLTTIAAFIPLLFIEGQIGDFMGVLPLVVVFALSASLLEALLILPAHLCKALRSVSRDAASGRRPNRFLAAVMPWRRAESRFFQDVLGGFYERFVRRAVTYRYVTVAVGLAGLLIAVGLVAGDRVPFVLIQKMDSETIMAKLEMPVGTPIERTRQAIAQVEQAALDSNSFPEVKSVFTLVGAQIEVDQGGAVSNSRSHLAQAIIELKTVDQRERDSDAIMKQLRKLTTRIPGVNKLRFNATRGGPGGADIELEVTGDHEEQILNAVAALKQKLREYDAIVDLADNYENGRREIRVVLLDSARPLELTTQSLATEVRGAFYGLEARTLQRDREDVDIRVRFSPERRSHIYDLESMYILTPAGNMVPMSEVARLEETRGYSAIRRINQRRAVTITADVNYALDKPNRIIADLEPTISELERSLPGVRIKFGGRKLETVKSLGSLKRDFLIVLVVVYVMLAGLFKSYVQPLVVLSAVPFGLIGAVVGHWILGFELTILSVIGIVALTGIVVNDGLILVNFINLEVAAGRQTFEAVIAAARRRLRPILLTSATTILGLAPLMMEQSFQARFLIPLAISITFGLAFATLLTLLVVPSIFMIVQDLKAILDFDDNADPNPARECGAGPATSVAGSDAHRAFARGP